MPLKDWNLRSTWDESYVIRAEREWGRPGGENLRPEVKLHYHRGIIGGWLDDVTQRLADYLTPASYNRRLLIVGGAFGWSAEYLQGLGFNDIVVTDTSQYVIDEIDNSEEVEIRQKCVLAGASAEREEQIVAKWSRGLRRPAGTTIIHEDIMTDAGRDAVNAAFGGPGQKPQIVVTEDVMPCLSDAEALALDAACYGWTPNPNPVVHIVSTLREVRGENQGDLGFNWKTLSEWKALIPGSYWLHARTGEVL